MIVGRGGGGDNSACGVAMKDELEIRELNHAEVREALRLSTQAGWNQVQQDWERLLRSLEQDCCFAGKVDGKLVATGTLAAYGNKCGWVGMILVDEAYRRRGYGEAMLNRVLRIADEMGLEWVGLDATELGKPLYLKKGFRTVGGVDRWRLSKAHQPVLMSGVREQEKLEKYSIQTLDLMASGMDRWKLFLDFTPEKGFEKVVCEKNGMLGFGISRPRRLGPYIGPVVAASEEIAAGIVSRLLERFKLGEETPVFLDVPRKSRLESWLMAEGFEVVRSWTRMIRGPAPRGNPDIYFAIAGPELG
jgi:GNAT superfamily N-acetyltransferase